MERDPGDNIALDGAKWTFEGDTHLAFDAHVEKSVPLYHEGHKIVCGLSDFFVNEGSICYELGSSTGTLTALLAERHQHVGGTRFVGIEPAKNMVSISRDRHRHLSNASFQEATAEAYEYETCSLVVAYYTVQFIPPRHRQPLFDRLYRSLDWGGGLLLFEKVRASDARFQDMINLMYYQFKLDNGYSAEQIIAKSMSLRGVLEPYSTRENYNFLERAGFKDIITVHKHYCFEGILAIK